ncbi:MAG: AAA family ATPase [Candidatus Rokubacteria bacterium]|nr:AAA family ATPase [Candidatus Rokubacteria bacterium]
MRCSRCQAENREGRRFCAECGASLAVACPSCSFLNEAGEKFCGGCGQALATGPQAETKFASPTAYTPKHLAEKILTSKRAMEGERKQVTVLFADLKGSMELLADRDPEDARRILDPVIERMMEAVHHYEGTVNQVMGDGIMALFGAPVAHEDHAIRACYTALRMQESVKRYAEEVQRTKGLPIHIRVGLNSGNVVVRSIGSDLHMDYTAVGQTTHLAARMEQMAMPGSILIPAHAFRLAEGFVQAKPLGAVPVKGLSEPIEVYEITGAGPVRSRLQAAAARGLTPFVGRDAELRQLRQALARARGGQGQAVGLIAEPGVGKSRLVWEFTHSCLDDEWALAEAGSVSYGTTTAYLPVIELLKAFFEIDGQEDEREIREKVLARLVALDEGLRPTLPAFQALLGVPVEDSDWQALDPSQRRQRTLEAITRLLLRASQVRPLLVFFENLHWVDFETQALLDRLVESIPDSRLLLLVSSRPEYRHDWGAQTHYSELRIAPLPRESAEALLEALLGSDRSLEPLKPLLIQRTEGNPFFLEESARTLVETQVLVGERGAYRLAKPLQSIQVPPTVQAVLASRIDRLPPEEKHLLQSAAVIGRVVPYSLFLAIADLEEAALRQGLTHLEAAEFVDETNLFPDLEYSFKHALTHEVAYASLLQQQRRAAHARILGAIEGLYAERLGEQIDRLAHHAFRGEVWDKAVRYLRQAGARALERAANHEAVACFEQALEALGHLPESRETIEQGIDLRLDLRAPLLQLGRLEEALQISKAAELAAEGLGDERRLARVYTYLINYHYLRGEPGRVIEYGERCLGLGESAGEHTLQTLTRRYMGQSHHAQGEYGQAESVLKRNLEVLEAVRGGPDDIHASLDYVASTGWLALTLAELGELDLAEAYLDKSQRAADASRHPYSQAIAWALTGYVLLRRGDLERAARLLERSLDACREKQLAVWQPIPSSLLGRVLVHLGRVDEGLPLLEAGVTLSENLGVKAYLALWTAQLGEGLLAAGQKERALEVARRALDLAVVHHERGHEAWTRLLLGDLVAEHGPPDVEHGEEHYREAIGIAEDLRMRPLLARVHLALGRLYRRVGNRRSAEEHLSTATVLLHKLDMRFWLKQTELELKQVGRLFIVARYNPDLYDYLRQEFSGEKEIRVILDRRQVDSRAAAEAQPEERRHADRRRREDIDVDLRSRGFVIITQLEEGEPPAPTGS